MFDDDEDSNHYHGNNHGIIQTIILKKITVGFKP